LRVLLHIISAHQAI